MQIMPVAYSTYYSNRSTTRPVSSVGFQGGSKELIPVAVDTFTTDSAKKMYPKISRLFQMLGKNGSVKDAPIFIEPTHYYNSAKHGYVDSTAEVLLSITKNSAGNNVVLSKRHYDTQNRTLMMNAFFDNEGRMIKGTLPMERMEFERKGANVRRMHCNGKMYLPIAGKEKDWEYAGGHLTSNDYVRGAENDSRGGAFEIFMELARLKTSLVK